jgi:hypothetical protein
MSVTASVRGLDEKRARSWLMGYAELATVVVLDAVGRRLTRTVGRAHRHRDSPVRQTDTHQRHTKIAVGDLDLDDVLAGAFRLVNLNALSAPDAECVRTAVHDYVRIIVLAGQPYDLTDLELVMKQAQCSPMDAAA